MGTDFNVINWIIVLIFVGGLFRLFFGGGATPASDDKPHGPGYYASREEAERHGARFHSNSAGIDYSLYEDGPGHYD